MDAATRSRVYTIGRYEIAGHLATGGMAEILLGRVVGPMGFERPVVIKRILPHLARDGEFVKMFMDEARIAARVHHRNVVQVHELIAEQEDELFIVMEYLEGESLSGVLRRLARRVLRFDPALTAYVMAEAAAGLHAAHELTDAAGNHLDLVHRDVSPQNIFLTYDGSVKVLDFGIAKAADKSTRTETGQLKGKFEYMSPEHCAGKPVDRRADIFCLGVVMWEMLTGHRLFKRKNKLLVLKAILDSPIVAPSSVSPECPRDLEAICMRALENKRRYRYQTAADMRRDLVEAHAAARVGVPDEALRDLMRELFADRIDEKREMLNRLRSGSELTHLPAAEVDSAIELPSVADGRPDIEDPSELSDLSSRREHARRGTRSRAPLWIAIFGSLAVAGAVAAFIATGGLEDPPPPVPAAASADPDPDPDPAPEAGAGTEPSNVVVHIESSPGGASVWLDGENRGLTPLALSLTRASSPVDVEVRLEDHRTETVQFVPDVDQRVRLSLDEVEAESGQRRLRVRRPRAAAEMKQGRYHRFE